jgi:hypothetical protein
MNKHTAQQTPATAFILAAGYGTRLQPLTLGCPKPLVPLWGRTMLQHHIHMLKCWGVQRLIVNTHHHARLVETCCRKHLPAGMQLSISHETEILGTGGALRHAAHLLPSDEPFWLLNADIAIDLNPTTLLNHFHIHHPQALLWLTDSRGPRTVERDGPMISTFRSNHPGTPDTCTFCGVQLIHPAVLRYLPDQPFSSIITAYETALRNGQSIHGITLKQAYWADIGTPQQYRETHREIEQAYRQKQPGGALYNPDALKQYERLTRQGIILRGFNALGHKTTISTGTTLQDCILWDGVSVEQNAQLHSVIAASPTRVVPAFAAKQTIITPARHTLSTAERRAAHRFFTAPYAVETLAARGSNRAYLRLANQSFSCILSRYDSQTRPENARHATHTKWLLRLNMPIPRLLTQSPQNGFAIYQDAGNIDLCTFVKQHGAQAALPLYQKVINAMHRLHSDGTDAARNDQLALEPPFTRDLYQWEYQLFINELVRERMTLTDLKVKELYTELNQITQHLLQQPAVLLHRDLQSSNILIHNQQIFLIDFQGMRFGAAAYDLASLLYDPYVELPEPMRESLLHEYNRKNTPPIESATLSAAVIQRMLQALGAYGRLGKDPATSYFRRFIHPALQRVKQALADFPKLTNLEQLTQSLDRC